LKYQQEEETFVPLLGSKIAEYKTKECHFYKTNGHCQRRDSCVFAHGVGQLRLNFQQPIPCSVMKIYQKIEKQKAAQLKKKHLKKEAPQYIIENNDIVRPNQYTNQSKIHYKPQTQITPGINNRFYFSIKSVCLIK